MSVLASYAIGLLGMALLTGAWLCVQLAWRRAFPEAVGDPDALAGRGGCGGCAPGADEECERFCVRGPGVAAPGEESTSEAGSTGVRRTP